MIKGKEIRAGRNWLHTHTDAFSPPWDRGFGGRDYGGEGYGVRRGGCRGGGSSGAGGVNENAKDHLRLFYDSYSQRALNVNSWNSTTKIRQKFQNFVKFVCRTLSAGNPVKHSTGSLRYLTHRESICKVFAESCESNCVSQRYKRTQKIYSGVEYGGPLLSLR